MVDYSVLARTAKLRRSAGLAAGASVLLVATACTSTPASGNAGGEIASFTIANSAPISSLDPASPVVANNITALVDQPLAVFKTDGTLVPELASRVTTTADQITFELRAGAKFSDGAPVTSDDVIDSLKRVITSPSYAQSFKSIKDMTAQGPSKVVVTLGAPDSTVLQNLLLYSQIPEKKQVAAAGDKFGSPSAPPVANGPYKVASFTSSGITLVPNGSYSGPPPKIKSLKFVYLSDENTAQLAMRAGSVNFYWNTSAQQIKAWSGVPGATVTTVPSIDDTFLGLDTKHAPFDDVHVRKAIAYAIDRRGLANAVYGGRAALLRSILSPQQVASVSSKDAALKFLATLPTYDFDVAKAKAELAQSRYPNGFSIDVGIAPFALYGDALLQNLQQNLKPLGVSITFKHQTYDQWNNALISDQDHGMQLWQYLAVAPQPNNALPAFVGTSPAANPNNTASYTPSTLDGPVSTLLTSGSTADQFAATKTILTSVAKDVPYIPLFNPDFLVVTSRGFGFSKNADLNDIFSDRLVNDITVAP